MSAIRRLLVANRGEIAVRVMRACRELGIAPIAVHSSIDRGALHVREADEAIEIGGPAPAESYLRVDAILDAAARTRADAIHPGYGFLSENAAFAAACRDAGVIFVGPPPEAIVAMGSKLGARERMQAAGVPVVPGATPSDQTDAGVRAAALAIGLPVVVKASGIYELPFTIMAAGNLQHYAGSPESTTVQVSSNTVTLTQVNQSFRLNRAERRERPA